MNISEELAFAELLTDDIVFISNYNETSNYISLYVNCSDLFMWACADAVELPYNKVLEAYCAYKLGNWTLEKWCCVQRNMQPQHAIIRDMKRDNAWDEIMEALPKNNLI